MSKDQHAALSKFLSYVLRHQPQAIGLQLDMQGWAVIDELLACAVRHGTALSHEQLLQIVAESDKQRFAISADGLFIRANQGHSLAIELALTAQTPPALLFHGTASRFLAAILQQGLQKGQRHHVHLTADQATALSVGQRYGSPVLLRIDTTAMRAQGAKFYLTANGVWLTDEVAPEFLTVQPLEQAVVMLS